MKTLSFPTAVILVCGAFSGESHADRLNADETPNFAKILGRNYDPWVDPTLNNFAPSSPGDSDLGEQAVLIPTLEYLPFSFELTTRARWTDNAGLDDLDTRTELDDIYSATSLSFEYLPLIGENTHFEFSTGYSVYRYQDHNSLDFDRFEISAGLIHCFRDLNNLIGWTRLKNYQLLTPSGNDDLYTSNTFELGLYYPIRLNSRHLAFASYSSKFSFDTDPGSLRRHEHWISGGYTFSPADRFKMTAYSSIHLYDYFEGGRTDVLFNTGVSLTSQLTDRLDVVLSANYTWNDSNTSGFDYEVTDIGANLGFTLKF